MTSHDQQKREIAGGGNPYLWNVPYIRYPSPDEWDAILAQAREDQRSQYELFPGEAVYALDDIRHIADPALTSPHHYHQSVRSHECDECSTTRASIGGVGI